MNLRWIRAWGSVLALAVSLFAASAFARAPESPTSVGASPASVAPVAPPSVSTSVASAPSASARPVAPYQEGLWSPDVIVPLVAVPTTFFALLAGIIAMLVFRYRSERQRLDALQFIVDKGQEVPPELLSRPASRASDLKKGLVLGAAGLGLSVALILVGEAGSAGFGLIPGFIGIAYIIVWRVERGARAGLGS